MIKSLFSKIKNNTKVEKLSKFCLIFFLTLYTFSLPSFSGRPVWYILSYALMGLSAFFVVFRYVFYEKFYFDKKLIILIVFCAEAFIGTAIHSHSFRHWLTIVLLFFSLVVFLYGFNVIDNKRLIFKMIAFALLGFGLYFMYYYRADILRINLNSSLGDDFDNVNTIGTYFSLGSVLFLHIALTQRKPFEWLYVIPAAFLLFIGMFTGSRHFIITTGVAFITTIIIDFRRKKWIAVLAIIAVIALFFVVIQLPFLSTIRERINRGITTLFGIGNAKYDPSVVQRTIWPRYGYNIAGREVLFGYGADGFAIYSGIDTYSHNTYSEILCNFGVLGAGIFFSALLYPLMLVLKSKRRGDHIVVIIVVFYLVKGFFGVYFSSKDAYIMIALLFYLTKDLSLKQYYGFNALTEFVSTDLCEVRI